MKNSSDSIRDRTSDLPICSTAREFESGFLNRSNPRINLSVTWSNCRRYEGWICLYKICTHRNLDTDGWFCDSFYCLKMNTQKGVQWVHLSVISLRILKILVMCYVAFCAETCTTDLMCCRSAMTLPIIGWISSKNLVSFLSRGSLYKPCSHWGLHVGYGAVSLVYRFPMFLRRPEKNSGFEPVGPWRWRFCLSSVYRDPMKKWSGVVSQESWNTPTWNPWRLALLIDPT